VGTLNRWFGLFGNRWLGACLPCLSVSADSVPAKDNSFPIGLPRLSLGNSRFGGPPGGLSPFQQSAAAALHYLSTQSPRLAAGRTLEESIV